MRILGVDPGLNVTGYGLIDSEKGSIRLLEAGVIETCAKDGLPVRLETIYRGLDELIKKSRPEVLVLEELYSHYKHPTTAILMGHARGAICLLCGIYRLKLVSLPPTKLKKSIVGHGRASKAQVEGMVRSILALKRQLKPPDVADALAIALSYAHSLRG